MVINFLVVVFLSIENHFSVGIKIKKSFFCLLASSTIANQFSRVSIATCIEDVLRNHNIDLDEFTLMNP